MLSGPARSALANYTAVVSRQLAKHNVAIDSVLPGMTANLDQYETTAHYSFIAGHRIAYWQAGQGEAILLVHGFPSAAWDWHCLWEPLAPPHNAAKTVSIMRTISAHFRASSASGWGGAN